MQNDIDLKPRSDGMTAITAKPRKIGYARVSTLDQSHQLQIDSLHADGCDSIYTETGSGKNFKDRPVWAEVFSQLKPGDTVVVWKLDRLSRSLRQTIETVETLSQVGVHLRVLTQQIDTSSSHGKFFFHILCALAEMERSLIVERTRAGLAVAAAAGRVPGRPPKLSADLIDTIVTLYTSGKRPVQIAASLDLALTTVYRALNLQKVPKPGKLAQPLPDAVFTPDGYAAPGFTLDQSPNS